METRFTRPRRTRIKVCGITSVELALAAVEAGADAIGLVRVRNSPRFVKLEPATDIILALPPFVTSVGVYRQHPRIGESPIDNEPPVTFVQLHGNQNEEDVLRMGTRVIRALAFDEAEVRRWDVFPLVEALLIEGEKSGEGEPFDHHRLEAIMHELRQPVLLAGGLTPDNVGKAIRAVRPYAVDVSSGVESKRGVKDPAMIRAFCDAVRTADAEITSSDASKRREVDLT